MAMDAGFPAMRVNGKMTPLITEDEEMYIDLLRIRDAVVAGKHPHFQLSPAVIAQLKASSTIQSRVLEPSKNVAIASHVTSKPKVTTDYSQLPSATFATPSYAGLPGLHSPSAPTIDDSVQPYGVKPATYAGLDPIFLEKSDSLVRAEGQLKRQRIERELQAQVEQRRQSARERDAGMDMPSAIDVEAVLLQSDVQVRHVSGLEANSPASGSFDENDYYSSQDQSDWSSEASPSKNSDRAVGDSMANSQHLNEPDVPLSFLAEETVPAATNAQSQRPSDDGAETSAMEIDDEYDPEEIDDEYTPPDVSAFANSNTGAHGLPSTTPDEDNSEYDPGETAPVQQPAFNSPPVPVIRNNHLTHIAAPQPNRVSPLAVAKGPSIELELVNGRPEIVQRPRQDITAPFSRMSSASPSGNGAPTSKKISKKAKKRKRREELEAARAERSKRKKDRKEAPLSANSSLPVNTEPIIKSEPVSTPPLMEIQDAPHPYAPPFAQNSPVEIDLISPRQPAEDHYSSQGLRRSKRRQPTQTDTGMEIPYEMAPSPGFRPVQRQSQDLRRVASLQYAQTQHEPDVRYAYPTRRTSSMAYNEHAASPQSAYFVADAEPSRYREVPPAPVQYVRIERSPSPFREREYHDSYAPQSMMPPPPSSRHIVVDQYGNQFYRASPAPQAINSIPRASVAPGERRLPMDTDYERAPSRMPTSYVTQYEPVENRMAPPPPPLRRPISDEHRRYYSDSNGYQVQEENYSPIDTIRYVEQPRSPMYQQAPRYETMPPPPAPMPPPAREQTSPIYVSRGYSVRPEESAPAAPSYIPRQASIAPVQYVRQEAPPPPRAVSAMSGFDQGMSTPYRTYSHAPQPVRYVDQNGVEVYPQEVRPISEYRY